MCSSEQNFEEYIFAMQNKQTNIKLLSFNSNYEQSHVGPSPPSDCKQLSLSLQCCVPDAKLF